MNNNGMFSVEENQRYCDMVTKVEHLIVTGKWVVDGNKIYFETYQGERQLSATFEDEIEAQCVCQIINDDIPWLRTLIGRWWDEAAKRTAAR